MESPSTPDPRGRSRGDAAAAVRLDAGDGRHVWFSGNLVTIKAGAGDAAGPSVLEARMHAGHAPPLHVHNDEDEAFYLLAGALRFRSGDGEFDVAPGDFVLVPRGTPHAFKVGPEGAHTLQFATSGMLAGFMEAAGEPAPEPVPPPHADFDRARVAAVAERFDMTVVGPPLA
ncbi:cupin domain-containing protein [Conexibacter sp. JD483]|uniref:cupin domain-containing protein n=1 Tax=unclassified Conexibacter TaxID=2627773 RepID=UPI00271A61BF|nr:MULTISPECIES: cupin domain-containing protein [unclassified Conexibacter]MDO8189313.1 cupin domain-containing protein [Conexibacter sp. CPCC 205706]MDO8201995.1 cupin domain-containing protein [Conexibacter sp. CPCC 205762]MDR9372304.1 cupin domain-containing protein [Conexibacter sp. JD483]